MNNWDTFIGVKVVIGPELPGEVIYKVGKDMAKASTTFIPRGDSEAISVIDPHEYSNDIIGLIDATIPNMIIDSYNTELSTRPLLEPRKSIEVHDLMDVAGIDKDFMEGIDEDYLEVFVSIYNHRVGAIEYTVHYLHI